MRPELLAKLEEALRQARASKSKDRDRLVRLLERVQAELRAETAGKGGLEGARSLKDQLESELAVYEAAHPALTAAVGDLSRLLSQLGI